MESAKGTFSNFSWLNEPSEWSLSNDVLTVKTDNKTDFWQETWYNFSVNTGHVYGLEIKEDFTMEVCVEAEFTTLYDQAGLMIYVDEKHWLKAGIEYNEGQPTIGSVLTNQVSDWATGEYTGNPKKYWLRLSKVGGVVCVKYSTDNVTWTLLRLSPFIIADKYFVGPMCCTPQREGLHVTFSNITIRSPDKDILHSN
ncbi:jg16262 [Pararge aegeria aegeria]|uniref:Jg16262 protein n=4 Tax=Pararge aegeria TaxID=116150 RepID=A0A8S4RWI0_9NEOP|nr:jg16262 [Pararge aegeria aegeria]